MFRLSKNLTVGVSKAVRSQVGSSEEVFAIGINGLHVTNLGKQQCRSKNGFS